MTPYSLYPAFIRMFYRTAYAPHTQTLPIKDWSPPSSGHDLGTSMNHLGDQADVQDMIDAYVLKAKAMFLATASIDSFIVYTMTTETSPAIPQVSYDVGVAGTNTNTGWSEAVQLTITMRTEDFHKAKYVYLDVPSDNDFNKYTNFSTLSTAFKDLIDVVRADEWSFVGRDGAQPSTFVSLIHDLNDKLRESYKLS